LPDAERIELEIRGMHCAGCVRSVENALRNVPGVTAASVNLATEHASVLVARAVATDELLNAVRAAGYEARLAAPTPDPADQLRVRAVELRRRRNRLLAAAALGAPVVAAHVLGHRPHAGPAFLPWQLVLSVGVVVVAAGPMIRGALRAVLARQANMDLLVSLGTLTALGASVVGLVTRTPELLLFDAATLIVLFVGLGKYLELRARGRASAALYALLDRIPRTALRVAGESVEPVPVDSVQPGDRLRVPAHQLVPVDGEVVAGHGTVDEALLTGESMPVERGPGQRVFGGTTVSSGLLEIRATATGRDSAAARLGRLVEQAQAAKPPWQRLADRAAAVFVPVVLLLALLTFFAWKWVAGAETFFALQRMIAVLVVACPCALGLAIPTAVLVGTVRAAERGILVRDASALEAAGRIQEVVLDKTGTLTLGQPALTRVVQLDALDEGRLLAEVAAVEQLSQHPLARALVQAVRVREIALPAAEELHSVPGAGLRGRVRDVELVVGTENWLQVNGVPTDNARQQADTLAETGRTVVWVARAGRPAALLAFADPLHPEAESAVAALRQLGIQMRILSGDQRPAVERIARELRIDAFEAELSPEQKLQRLRELVRQGRLVAMVGDGINDAPALAAAHVGIALGTGADVAREAADICLVGSSPSRIADAIRISRASARIMKQNLFWAVAYNLVMLPAAMLTSLPPAWATAAMMLSSLTVVGNALRLRRAA
jgi:Cu+-exporting ATPase